MNITNISISDGIDPQPSINPANISRLFYNWSSAYEGTALLANVRYVKFNFYQKKYNNYTKTNYTIINTTSHSIPINTKYVIKMNDSLYLNFTVPSRSQGTAEYYTITFNTNYGIQHSLLSINAP